MRYGYQNDEARRNKKWSRRAYQERKKSPVIPEYTARKGSYVAGMTLFLTLLLLFVIWVMFRLTEHSWYVATELPQVKAVVVDSSKYTRINGVLRWSELDISGVKTIVKYSTLPTAVNETVSVYYDSAKQKAYHLTDCVISVLACGFAILIIILRIYGYLYEFYVQKRHMRLQKTVQNDKFPKNT